jgi:hypothetical protein
MAAWIRSAVREHDTQARHCAKSPYPTRAMNEASPTHPLLQWAVLLGCLACLLAAEANGQTQDVTPSSLVKFLTRPNDGGVGSTFSCGINDGGRAMRAAAQALVSQGQTALPAIEQALDLLENGDARASSPSSWLFYAYAKIQGRHAFPRLWTLVTKTDPASYDGLLSLPSDSMALALDLTSYVPDSRPLTRILHCVGGFQQPRDALNQLILAWERADQSWFESSLGPDATAALESLRKERTWTAMRTSLWPARSSGHTAVGYRFDLLGRFSISEMDLIGAAYGDSNLPGLNAPLPKSPEFLLATRFTDKIGKDCGTLDVKFLNDPHPSLPGAFLVNNSDLEALLRLISSCAAQ